MVQGLPERSLLVVQALDKERLHYGGVCVGQLNPKSFFPIGYSDSHFLPIYSK
jgi:hypothetical protein